MCSDARGDDKVLLKCMLPAAPVVDHDVESQMVVVLRQQFRQKLH